MAAMANVRINVKLTVENTVLALIPKPFFIFPSHILRLITLTVNYIICPPGKKESDSNPFNSKGDTASAISPNA